MKLRYEWKAPGIKGRLQLPADTHRVLRTLRKSILVGSRSNAGYIKILNPTVDGLASRQWRQSCSHSGTVLLSRARQAGCISTSLLRAAGKVCHRGNHTGIGTLCIPAASWQRLEDRYHISAKKHMNEADSVALIQMGIQTIVVGGGPVASLLALKSRVLEEVPHDAQLPNKIDPVEAIATGMG